MWCAYSHIFHFFLIFGRVYARQPKIAEFDIQIFINKQIRALEIAMEHIFLMQVRHPQSNIFTEADQKFLRQLLILLMKIIKQTASR